VQLLTGVKSKHWTLTAGGGAVTGAGAGAGKTVPLLLDAGGTTGAVELTDGHVTKLAWLHFLNL
jgi:hypothetical protein